VEIVREIYEISRGVIITHAWCSTESRREVLLLSDLTETQSLKIVTWVLRKLTLGRFVYELGVKRR
jgi:hypothetical protein